MSLEHDNIIRDFHEKQEAAGFSATLNRACSITVGTCFNSLTEIVMRGNDGKVLWCPMFQHETLELIHQLAASVGCHVALKPRQDFGSWRTWKEDDTPLLGGDGSEWAFRSKSLSE